MDRRSLGGDLASGKLNGVYYSGTVPLSSRDLSCSLYRMDLRDPCPSPMEIRVFPARYDPEKNRIIELEFSVVVFNSNHLKDTIFNKKKMRTAYLRRLRKP